VADTQVAPTTTASNGGPSGGEPLVETNHGSAQVRGQASVARSTLKEGRFGRMFRTLSPLDPGDDAIHALVQHMKDASEAPSGDNKKIPAGYTYLGQFIDHDITFDPMSQLQKQNDPDALIDFRTPRFDLDSLYGSGPSDSPFLYANTGAGKGLKLLVGHNPANSEFERDDLPRNQEGRALIGDPRNDENIIVSQLQLLFIRFHNKVVDRVKQNHPDLKGGALLEECQRVVRWHYQWIVVHDFLERVVGQATAQAVLQPGTATTPPVVDRQFFTWTNEPFMPVEFSGAAYRFGHSMVRPDYDLNEIVVQVPIFVPEANPDILSHLGGFRRLPSAWTVEWSRFFKTTSSAPQFSRKIDVKLSAPLFKLPGGVDPNRRALAGLNLRRGRALGLPSGQDVAAAMSITPLTAAELDLDGLSLTAAQKTALKAHTPLWYYLLREAQVKGSGEHLGPVGGRIVAEVLVGLLDGDPQSYLSQKPLWKPFLPAATAGDFTMKDLVKFTLA
jgi:Animal haem peroxidase